MENLQFCAQKFYSVNPFMNNGNFLRTGPRPVRSKKIAIHLRMSAKRIIFYFLPVQPCTMNVRKEPLHDMACVVKCETPPEWRWKLCEFQRGKRTSEDSVLGILIGLRGFHKPLPAAPVLSVTTSHAPLLPSPHSN